MVKTTADTIPVGDKTLRKVAADKSNKIGASFSEKGGNRVGNRKTPSWQRPISNFFTLTQSDNSKQKEKPPPGSESTAFKGSVEGTPVEIVISVDVEAYFDVQDEDCNTDQDFDMEQTPEEQEADKYPPERIKYEEFTIHTHFLESLLH